MLHSIIPPILVVLSIIGIIIFLMKKAPEINRLEKAEKMDKERQALLSSASADGFPARAGEGSGAASKLRQWWLVFLEKMVKRFRIGLLKAETAFKAWGEGIRKKRNGTRAAAGTIDLQEKLLSGDNFADKEKEALDGVVDRPEVRDPEKKVVQERMASRRQAKEEEIEDKYYRPMVSDRVVVPKRRRETKTRLEELLIERIAANPKDIEAYERLGEYYLEVRNIDHSKECFKQVLRLNPGNRNARYKLRKLEKILGS